jgi:alkanesulfonate monooxygenase SsuD/methylene tetrahydromethanopterin reductase-like flavin-dependent oxidoreductase (luciferase family)
LPVQQPLPPVIVATRSDDTVKYAADHGLGLGVSFVPADRMAAITQKYFQWCEEAGWQPEPDQVVFRGSIYLAETDRQAEDWLASRTGSGPTPGGIAMSAGVSRAVDAARQIEGSSLRAGVAGSPRGDVVGVSGRLNFMGCPDTVVRQIKEFRDECGAGVVDLFFQQPGVTHQEVMREIDLFGREVLPRIREF